ncbi:Alpha/Beta hydrolase protein [Mycena filopes]|nr:Alpha/Beta hydrolase protein [Mycena filopes]
MAPSLSRYSSYLPLLIPSLLAASYILASRRTRSKLNKLPAPVDPGLGSLPLNSRARVVYSEDWLEGGAYVQLPMGRVRYWLVGPVSDKKVVLIHGLTTPALVFKRLVPILIAAGYQILLYDLYGRGYSDAPQNITYDAHLYVTQLALLLQHVGWERAHLTLAPFSRIQNLPFVQALTLRAILSKVIKPPPTGETPLNEIVRLQASSLRGFAHAVISSLHDGAVAHMRWAFVVPGWCGRRVLFIHGTNDTIVPPQSSPLLRSLVDSVSTGGNSISVASGKETKAKTTLVSIEGAGHYLIWSRADEVGEAIVGFLEEK